MTFDNPFLLHRRIRELLRAQEVLTRERDEWKARAETAEAVLGAGCLVLGRQKQDPVPSPPSTEHPAPSTGERP